MSDLKLDVAYGIGRKQNITHWRNDTVTWDEVVGWADTEQTTEKERAGSYVFGSLVPTPQVDHTVTGCPADCTDLHRNKAAIQERRAFTLDVDNAPLDFAERVKALGVTALLHTTASSTPEMPRLRLIVPTDRPMKPTEFRQCSDHLMRLLSRDGDPEGMFDPTCDQAERVMYKPTGTSVEKWVTDGPLFGVGEILPEAVRQDKVVPHDETYYDDSPQRDPALGVHRLAQEAIDAEMARLDVLPYPWVSGQSFWDTTTFEVACALVRYANSGWTGYTLEQAEADLHEHAPTDDEWGSGNHRVKWDRALNTVDGAGIWVRLAPEEEDGFEFEPPVTKLVVADLVDLMHPDRPARHWLMEDVVPTGDQTSIVAPGGVGKSLWVLGLALAAASGATTYCGKKIDLVGRVFYLDLENSNEDWVERLHAYGWTHESIRQIRGRFIPLVLPPLAGLDTEKGAAQLKEFLQAWGVRAGDLLVMDSLQRVTEGAENDSDTLRDLYNRTSMWLKGLGVTVIRTDNTGKDEGKGARGTSGKRDDVGYSYTLSTVGGAGSSRFRLTSTKHRSAGGGGVLAFERKTDAQGRLVWEQDFAAATLDYRPTDLMEALSIALEGATVPLSQNVLLAAVKGRAGDKKIALGYLIDDGYVRRDRGKNNTSLHRSTRSYRASDDHSGDGQ